MDSLVSPTGEKRNLLRPFCLRLPAPGNVPTPRHISRHWTNLGIILSTFCLLASTISPAETVIDQGNIASAAIDMQVRNPAPAAIDSNQLRDNQKANMAILEQQIASEPGSARRTKRERDQRSFILALDSEKNSDPGSQGVEKAGRTFPEQVQNPASGEKIRRGPGSRTQPGTPGSTAVADQSAVPHSESGSHSTDSDTRRSNGASSEVSGSSTASLAATEEQSLLANARNSFLLRVNSALDAHDYRTMLSFLPNGRTDYFGHRNASSSFIESDLKNDARTYRWTKSDPDLSTFRKYVDSRGITYESIEMETAAEEVSGKRHHAHVEMDISYRNDDPPSILSINLRVIK